MNNQGDNENALKIQKNVCNQLSGVLVQHQSLNEVLKKNTTKKENFLGGAIETLNHLTNKYSSSADSSNENSCVKIVEFFYEIIESQLVIGINLYNSSPENTLSSFGCITNIKQNCKQNMTENKFMPKGGNSIISTRCNLTEYRNDLNYTRTEIKNKCGIPPYYKHSLLPLTKGWLLCSCDLSTIPLFENCKFSLNLTYNNGKSFESLTVGSICTNEVLQKSIFDFDDESINLNKHFLIALSSRNELCFVFKITFSVPKLEKFISLFEQTLFLKPITDDAFVCCRPSQLKFIKLHVHALQTNSFRITLFCNNLLQKNALLHILKASAESVEELYE